MRLLEEKDGCSLVMVEKGDILIDKQKNIFETIEGYDLVCIVKNLVRTTENKYSITILIMRIFIKEEEVWFRTTQKATQEELKWANEREYSKVELPKNMFPILKKGWIALEEEKENTVNSFYWIVSKNDLLKLKNQKMLT